MSILENLWQGMLPQPLRQKAIYDVQRVGVQGRAVYPDTAIDKLQLAHRRSEIVYAAIKAKATAVIDPRLLVERKSAEWSEDAGHPLRRLLMRPNAEMDEAAFLAAMVTNRDIAGVAYAEIVRAQGSKLPVALHVLDPARLAPVRGDRNTTAAYEFRDGNLKIRIDAKDMLVWRHHDPISRWQGLSPLAVALGSVDADSAQTDFVRDFFGNAGVPSGMLKIKGRTITEDEANHIKARWRTRFGRNWGGMHDIAVMDENAEYEKMGANLNELQSEILREFTETRVCMVFGVPPLIIYAFAGLKRATYSNLKEAWAGFWDATLTPLLKEWRTFLTWRLLPEFESEDLIYGERVRLNWDLSQVTALQDDVDAVQLRARENFKAGGITLNEFRAAVKQEPDSAGDYYLRGLAQVDVPANEQTEPAPEPVKRRRLLSTKALRDATTVTIERRMRQAIEPYLLEQYTAAANAIRSST